MNDYFVSIIIVSLNRKRELVKCLNSIHFQKFKNFEVILIDNNSLDGTSEFIKNKFPNTKIYKTKKNLGTSYTRNAAINFSKGNIIWFLDSDVYLENENSLRDMVNKLNHDVDALGGEAILNEKNEIVGTKKLSLESNGMVRSSINSNEKLVEVDVLATCNLMTKKECLRNIGGFDHYYFFYLEDQDLTYRMKKKGYKLYLQDHCNIIHYFSEKSRFKNYFASNRNRIYFLVKNFNLLKILLLPYFDLMYVFKFDSLKKVYKKIFSNKEIEKYKIQNTSAKISNKNVLITIKQIIIIFSSMIFSYLYIPYYIFLINKIKKKNYNFLDKVNNEDFIEIKIK